MRRFTSSLTASLFGCLLQSRRKAEQAQAQADSSSGANSRSPSRPSKLTFVSSLATECAAAANRRKTHDQLEWRDVRMIIMSLWDRGCVMCISLWDTVVWLCIMFVCLSLYLSSHFHYCCSSPFVSTRVQVQHAGHVQQGSLVRYIDEFGSNVTGKNIFRDELFLFFSSRIYYIFIYLLCVYLSIASTSRTVLWLVISLGRGHVAEPLQDLRR